MITLSRWLLISHFRDVSSDAARLAPLTLLVLQRTTVSSILRSVESIFVAEPTFLEITGLCDLTSDLHSQILPLVRIITTIGLPANHCILSLGDLVERGGFSVEVLVIVFLMESQWPQQFFLIRGNHENDQLCSQGDNGFMTQMIDAYNSGTLYTQAIQVFRFIPLGALLNDRILCAHGSIDSNLDDCDQIRFIQRPIPTFGDRSVDALTWSDPAQKIPNFHPSRSRRAGFMFGQAALDEFLRSSELYLLVRAQECVPLGYACQLNEQCLAIFCASNYCGMVGNTSAILEVTVCNEHHF
jgi:hypothetical protein